jgi:hypothetical protein
VNDSCAKSNGPAGIKKKTGKPAKFLKSKLLTFDFEKGNPISLNNPLELDLDGVEL